LHDCGAVGKARFDLSFQFSSQPGELFVAVGQRFDVGRFLHTCAIEIFAGAAYFAAAVFGFIVIFVLVKQAVKIAEQAAADFVFEVLGGNINEPPGPGIDLSTDRLRCGNRRVIYERLPQKSDGE
jgi:hypothetical protein